MGTRLLFGCQEMAGQHFEWWWLREMVVEDERWRKKTLLSSWFLVSWNGAMAAVGFDGEWWLWVVLLLLLPLLLRVGGGGGLLSAVLYGNGVGKREADLAASVAFD